MFKNLNNFGNSAEFSKKKYSQRQAALFLVSQLFIDFKLRENILDTII